jgi:hypothetical protein
MWCGRSQPDDVQWLACALVPEQWTVSMELHASCSMKSRHTFIFYRQCQQGCVSTSRHHENLSNLIIITNTSVISIAKTSPYQLPRTNIRVNSLCPGLTETGMTEPLFEHARERGTTAKIGQLNPMGRPGLVEGECFLSKVKCVTNAIAEMARASLFLASGESSLMTTNRFVYRRGIIEQTTLAMSTDRTSL